MGLIKGQQQWKKWREGSSLTRKEAMLAMCFECNGFEDSAEDCQARHCPMYQYHPYRIGNYKPQREV